MKNRSLYATITVAKENQKKDIQIFETEDQKAGMGNFLEKDKAKKLKVVPFKNR